MTCPSKRKYERLRAHYLPEWKEAGKRLLSLRKGAELTQEEVADKCGISLTYYRHLEQGYNNPRACTMDTKKALAKAFHIKAEELF